MPRKTLVQAMSEINDAKKFEKDLVRFSNIKNVEETTKIESKRIDEYISNHKHKDTELYYLLSLIRSVYFLDNDSYHFYEKIILKKIKKRLEI